MADWEKLHEVGREAAPPPFSSLVTEAGRRDRRARLLVGTATLAVVTTLGLGIALADDDEDGAFEPARDPSPSISRSSDDGELPDGVRTLPEAFAGEQVELDAGRYRVELTETLAFDVDVPGRTSAHDNGTFLATRDFVLKAEVAGDRYGVPSDPCTAHYIESVGPTVDDLLDALVELPVYQTTRPEKVRVGGAGGSYVEARIPRSYDASSCEDAAVALPGNPSTGVSAPPPYIGRWWVLDVDGQRVVIQQNCWGCGVDDLNDPATMVDSITFATTS